MRTDQNSQYESDAVVDRAELVDVLVENPGSNPILANHHDATLNLRFFLLQNKQTGLGVCQKMYKKKVCFIKMAQLFQTDGQNLFLLHKKTGSDA